MADVESKSIPHELPSSHWLMATGQCVLERYLSATIEAMSKKQPGPFDYPKRLRDISAHSNIYLGTGKDLLLS